MTEPVVFGSLEPVPLRSAWPHEARAFTPWLAENIKGLSAAIGVDLEVTGTEVAVETFSADILARDARDGTIVLIENQLEEGDHRHLGQIMTYLAGLNAQIVVWIASDFRDAHLSAIRWLNEHTVAPFAFFAVRLRVVRIGNSPYAPLFDVLERPNGWDRSLQEAARESREPSTVLGATRREFWTFFLARHPDEAAHGKATASPSRWRVLQPIGIVVGQYLADNSIGVFVRGLRNVPIETVMTKLEPFKDALQARLGVTVQIGGYAFIAEKKRMMSTRDQSQWAEIADWLHAEANAYEAALREILGAQS